MSVVLQRHYFFAIGSFVLFEVALAVAYSKGGQRYVVPPSRVVMGQLYVTPLSSLTTTRNRTRADIDDLFFLGGK